MKNGWPKRRLKDVCTTIQDGAHESPKTQFSAPGQGRFLYITSKNIRTNYMDLSDVSYVGRDFHDKIYPRCQPQFGDVLLTKDGASTGNVTLNTIDEPFSLLSSVCLLKAERSQLEPAFLCYYLQSPDGLRNITGQMTGAAIKRIILAEIKSANIPCPPLSEQRRIVGILDKAFEAIATAKANAEENLQKARAIFESHLYSVFADSWRTSELVRLSDVASDITDGDHLPPPKSPTGVPFITIGNILKQSRKIDFADTFKVPHSYFNALKPNRKPKKGDVLYTVTGSFGIPVVVDENVDFCFQRHIGLVRPKSEINSRWLYYLLLSPQISKQAIDGATGTAQKTVSLKLLRSFEVPRVPPKQQQTTASKLDAISAETERLESIYERKLLALEALKRSLLHRAFTGNL